jgi:hypothetical protein
VHTAGLISSSADDKQLQLLAVFELPEVQLVASNPELLTEIPGAEEGLKNFLAIETDFRRLESRQRSVLERECARASLATLDRRWTIKNSSLKKRLTPVTSAIELELSEGRIDCIACFNIFRLFHDVRALCWHLDRWLRKGLLRLLVVRSEMRDGMRPRLTVSLIERTPLLAFVAGLQQLFPERRGGARRAIGTAPRDANSMR